MHKFDINTTSDKAQLEPAGSCFGAVCLAHPLIFFLRHALCQLKTTEDRNEDEETRESRFSFSFYLRKKRSGVK